MSVFGSDTNRAILITVKNAPELARSQGAMASFAQALAPATIESKVVSTVADKLAKALKDQNVDADVKVVEPSAYRSAGMSHVWTDVGFAIGGAGILALFYYLLRKKK